MCVGLVVEEEVISVWILDEENIGQIGV